VVVAEEGPAVADPPAAAQAALRLQVLQAQLLHLPEPEALAALPPERMEAHRRRRRRPGALD
jgi:hypothetical protein